MLAISAAILCLLAVVASHPPLGAKMHEAVAVLVNQIDNTQLTSKPMLKMIEHPQDVKAATGDMIKLHCEVTSTPSAVFHWTLNGKLVQGDMDLNVYEKIMNVGKSTVESGIVATTYVIPCASQADAGEYKCIAYNGHETIEGTAEVAIVGEDVPCKSARRDKPEFIQYTDSRFEMDTNSATLLCRTDRAANIAWAFEGELVNVADESKYEQLPNGDLIVKNLAWPDMGTYECIATNKYGQSKVESFLYPSKKRVLIQ